MVNKQQWHVLAPIKVFVLVTFIIQSCSTVVNCVLNWKEVNSYQYKTSQSCLIQLPPHPPRQNKAGNVLVSNHVSCKALTNWILFNRRKVMLVLRHPSLFSPTELQYLQADYNGRYINAGTQICWQLPHVGWSERRAVWDCEYNICIMFGGLRIEVWMKIPEGFCWFVCDVFHRLSPS